MAESCQSYFSDFLPYFRWLHANKSICRDLDNIDKLADISFTNLVCIFVVFLLFFLFSIFLNIFIMTFFIIKSSIFHCSCLFRRGKDCIKKINNGSSQMHNIRLSHGHSHQMLDRSNENNSFKNQFNLSFSFNALMTIHLTKISHIYTLIVECSGDAFIISQILTSMCFQVFDYWRDCYFSNIRSQFFQ